MIARLLTLWSRYRKQVIGLIILFAVSFAGFYLITPFILDDLVRILPEEYPPVQHVVGEVFYTRLLLAALCAAPLCLATVLWRLLRRLKLHRTVLTLCSTALFASGLVFARLMLLPNAIGMLLSILKGRFAPNIVLYDYAVFCVTFLALVAMLFETPLLIYLLYRLEIVDAAKLRRLRKRILIGMLIVLAILTPSQDAITLILAVLPLCVLYEGSILMLSLMERRNG